MRGANSIALDRLRADLAGAPICVITIPRFGRRSYSSVDGASCPAAAPAALPLAGALVLVASPLHGGHWSLLGTAVTPRQMSLTGDAEVRTLLCETTPAPLV